MLLALKARRIVDTSDMDVKRGKLPGSVTINETKNHPALPYKIQLSFCSLSHLAALYFCLTTKTDW